MSTTREQGYPSNVSISDNSYCDPSYNPRQTKVTKRPYVWDGVTRRDKSRIDPALKPLISENHKTYTALKAHPYEWQEMLDSLDIFEPNRWLSEKPICRLLMDMWWPLRYSPNTCLAYLPFTVLQDMSIEVSRQGRGNPDDEAGFVGSPLYPQYSSIIPSLLWRRVGFVLIRNLESMRTRGSPQMDSLQNPNHFFAVVFDYDSQTAHSFGAFCGSRSSVDRLDGSDSTWSRWCGPELWNSLARSLGWSDALGPLEEIKVISKEWQQVNHHHSTSYTMSSISQPERL